MEHLWNDTDSGVSGDKVSQCHFVHHKYHRDWPGLKSSPPKALLLPFVCHTMNRTDGAVIRLKNLETFVCVMGKRRFR